MAGDTEAGVADATLYFPFWTRKMGLQVRRLVVVEHSEVRIYDVATAFPALCVLAFLVLMPAGVVLALLATPLARRSALLSEKALLADPRKWFSQRWPPRFRYRTDDVRLTVGGQEGAFSLHSQRGALLAKGRCAGGTDTALGLEDAASALNQLQRALGGP